MNGESIQALVNLGPKSAAMLAEAGIKTIEELRTLGAVGAYARVKFLHPKAASRNLLWSLAAGLEGRHWNDLDAAEKAALEAKLAVAASS